MGKAHSHTSHTARRHAAANPNPNPDQVNLCKSETRCEEMCVLRSRRGGINYLLFFSLLVISRATARYQSAERTRGDDPIDIENPPFRAPSDAM